MTTRMPGHRIYRSKKFRRLHRLAIASALLLVVTIVLYFFVVGPTVFRTEAQQQMMLCLKICAAGVNPCVAGPCANPPYVTTQAVSDIETTSATGHATVVADGGDTVTDRGIVIATTTSPTVDNTQYTATTTGTGVYSVILSSLNSQTLYYARAYALNSAGTSYGSTVSFTTKTPSSGGNQSSGSLGNSGGGSGQLSNDKKPKKKLQDYLIPGYPIQDRTDLVMDSIFDYRNAKGEALASKHAIPTIHFKQPTFRGKTNIKNAYVLISLHSETHLGTTRPGQDGSWEWTVMTPLDDGIHTISVEAVSPDDPSVSGSVTYTFYVTTKPAEQPVPEQPVTPTTPTSSATILPEAPGGGGGVPIVEQQPIVPGDSHEYVIKVEVLSTPEEIASSGSVNIKTEVVKFNPSTPEPVLLTYNLYDNQGAKIFTEEKQIVVSDKTVEYSKAITSTPLKPGTYVLDVQLTYKNKSIGTTKVFEVKSYHVIDVPLVSISQETAKRTLYDLILIFATLSALFLYLMRREYVRLKKHPFQVTDNDLFNSGMIR